MPDKSWVPGADTSGFSLANLPYGIALLGGKTHVCVAIGDMVLNLAACAAKGLLDGISVAASVWDASTLNPFLRQTPTIRRAIRERIRTLLGDNYKTERHRVEACLHPRQGLVMGCPVAPGDYVDFYSSMHHALRSMRASDVDPILHPNWTSLPVGYHGRTSTIIGSGREITRPQGQSKTEKGVVFRPTEALDYEVELGYVIGSSTVLGKPLASQDFPEVVFGLILLNDWSARDIQRWESTPLGPFLAKSFATQTGSWVVPMEALEPYRRVNPNAAQAIGPLRHEEPFAFDIQFEVAISSSAMRSTGAPPTVTGRSNATDLHWDGAQQLAHMTTNGACVRAGDLYGSGTVSGEMDENAGCLLERTQGGRPLITLADGTTRGWLQDGDQVVIRGRAVTSEDSIDFGELSGVVVPAQSQP